MVSKRIFAASLIIVCLTSVIIGYGISSIINQKELQDETELELPEQDETELELPEEFENSPEEDSEIRPPQPPYTPQIISYALQISGVMDWKTWMEYQSKDTDGSIIEGEYVYTATVEIIVKNIGEDDVHGISFSYDVWNEAGNVTPEGYIRYTNSKTCFVGNLAVGETKTFALTNFRLNWQLFKEEWKIYGLVSFRADEVPEERVWEISGGTLWWWADDPRSDYKVLSWEINDDQ